MIDEYHTLLQAANEFYKRHQVFYEGWLNHPASAETDKQFMDLMTSVKDLRDKNLIPK